MQVESLQRLQSPQNLATFVRYLTPFAQTDRYVGDSILSQYGQTVFDWKQFLKKKIVFLKIFMICEPLTVYLLVRFYTPTLNREDAVADSGWPARIQ